MLELNVHGRTQNMRAVVGHQILNILSVLSLHLGKYQKSKKTSGCSFIAKKKNFIAREKISSIFVPSKKLNPEGELSDVQYPTSMIMMMMT